MFQRALDAGARLLIFGSRSRRGWALGVVSLAVAKSIENMEIGHNVAHGQWDWMNDPEIHSATWEWDMAGLMSQWRYSHNYRHHVFANVVGVDDDLGFGIMRVTRDVAWRPRNLMQPFRNALLAVIFEWGIALHGLHSDHERAASPDERNAQTRAFKAKIKRQVIKDYVADPGPQRISLATGVDGECRSQHPAQPLGLRGDLLRAFPDGVATFTPDAVKQESKGEWYLRQMLGSANFKAGRVLAFLSGNLCYQIEHHLFPDLPSNRYAAIAPPGAGAVRHLRAAVHHGTAAEPVPADPADHPEVGTAGSLRPNAGPVAVDSRQSRREPVVIVPVTRTFAR